MISDNYLKWVKAQKDLKPLTGSQHEFVEFLLKHHKITKRTGAFIHLFENVRDFIRDNPKLFEDEKSN